MYWLLAYAMYVTGNLICHFSPFTAKLFCKPGITSSVFFYPEYYHWQFFSYPDDYCIISKLRHLTIHPFSVSLRKHRPNRVLCDTPVIVFNYKTRLFIPIFSQLLIHNSTFPLEGFISIRLPNERACKTFLEIHLHNIQNNIFTDSF